MPFSDILGHERIIEILRRSIHSGKTAHAYIFEGIPGCGRRKTALSLIQALYCSNVADDACGVCSSCRKVAAGNHADIHFVEPLPDKRDINISQLRDLQRELALRPYEAPRKACILEPAERMNVNSANSFLKTLEEPPGNAIIILLTENSDMLLSTIRSRCQLIRFSPLSSEHVKQLLESGGMDSNTASIASQLADGSMQKAMVLDNEALTERREMLVKQLSELSLGRIITVFETSEKLSGNREDTLETLDILLSIVRDHVYASAGSAGTSSSAIRSSAGRLSSSITLANAIRIADEVIETRRSVQRNANSKLALDSLFMRIAGIAA